MDKELKIIPPEGYEIDRQNSTFDCIKFKPVKKEFPKTWEEFCKNNQIKGGEFYIDALSSINSFRFKVDRNPQTDKCILPSEKMAKAVLALCQLIQLRDCYNDGWEPDWENSFEYKEYKYTIYSKYGEITIGLNDVVSRILSFRTKELRDEFIKNFRELIEVAKPLL